MKINAKLASIVLLFGVIISLVWGGRQCSGKEYWEGRTAKLKADSVRNDKNVARWGKDSVKLIGVILTQKRQINDAIQSATNWKARFDGQLVVSDKQVDALSYRAKQIALLRDLVANKTLSPIYLRDTLLIAIPDTAILTATAKTTKRGNLALRSVDSLVNATTMQSKEIDRLNTSNQRARSSSLYAQEKLQKLSERKPLFSRSRRKQASDAAVEVRIKRESEISDLERVINQ